MGNFPFEVQAYFLNYIRDQKHIGKKYILYQAVLIRRPSISLWFAQLTVTTDHRKTTFPRRLYR